MILNGSAFQSQSSVAMNQVELKEHWNQQAAPMKKHSLKYELNIAGIKQCTFVKLLNVYFHTQSSFNNYLTEHV